MHLTQERETLATAISAIGSPVAYALSSAFVNAPTADAGMISGGNLSSARFPFVDFPGLREKIHRELLP